MPLAITACAFLLLLTACASNRPPELQTVSSVDLERFMGDWFVLASIPTVFEREAYDAVESYELDADGSIRTTFTFKKGGFDGPEKTFTPRGFVREGSGNARWGMRFVWPIKADYRIIYLDSEYETTVIGRQKRDYVWIMARRQEIDEDSWKKLERVVADAGYDTTALRRVPHQRRAGEDIQ